MTMTMSMLSPASPKESRCLSIEMSNGDVSPTSLFDDWAMLEEGAAHEFIAPEIMRCRKVGEGWVQCKITRPEKSEFRLLEEGTDRFLLSAKRVGNAFYISTYETPSECKHSSTHGAAAVLEPPPTPPNSPTNNCSHHQGFFNFQKQHHQQLRHHQRSLQLLLCGATKSDPLLTVWPSASWSDEQQAELRKIRVALHPEEEEETEAHYVHNLSPRTPTRRKIKRDVSPLPDSLSPTTATSPTSESRNSSFTSLDELRPPPRIFLANKVPKWNSQLGCLSLNFARRRIKCSSTKNFLIYTEECLNDPKKSEPADNAVFQLGKAAKKTFALDYKHPLSTLQAFAIALSAFNVSLSKKQ